MPRRTIILLAAPILLILAACAPTSTPSASQPALPPYNGPIETVAIVMRGDNSFFRSYRDLVYDEALTTFFQSSYARSRFDVVERDAVNRLLNEQDLIRQGYVDNELGPRLGRLIGANYVLFVDLTHVSAESVSVGGLSVGGIRLGGSGYQVDARVSMQLVDTETGVIVARSTGRVNTMAAQGVNIGGIRANVGAREGAILTTLPQAIKQALEQLLMQIA